MNDFHHIYDSFHRSFVVVMHLCRWTLTLTQSDRLILSNLAQRTGFIWIENQLNFRAKSHWVTVSIALHVVDRSTTIRCHYLVEVEMTYRWSVVRAQPKTAKSWPSSEYLSGPPGASRLCVIGTRALCRKPNSSHCTALATNQFSCSEIDLYYFCSSCSSINAALMLLFALS